MWFLHVDSSVKGQRQGTLCCCCQAKSSVDGSPDRVAAVVSLFQRLARGPVGSFPVTSQELDLDLGPRLALEIGHLERLRLQP